MLYIITLITYCFDLFIIISFMNGILNKKKENISNIIFFFSFILMEFILFTNECVTEDIPDEPALIATSLVSVITTFALTHLYNAPLRHKIFITAIFQILAMFGEYIFTLVIKITHPEIFSISKTSLNIMMNLGSKVCFFLLTLICVLFWNKKLHKYTIQYNLLLFSTPCISMLIMLSTPLEDIAVDNNQRFFLVIYTSLAILNIINFLLLEKTFRQTKNVYKLQQVEQQVKFQKEKYIQLSAAYKVNRSVLHDTRKHYFAIQEYINQKEYDKLHDYLQIAIENMENIYISVNTGNLVIDSFVSNFKKVTENNSIPFSFDISVDSNRIPINDYDLCVILGNLLDNSLNACKRNTENTNRIILEMSINENDTFLIFIANTYKTELNNKLHDDLLFEHGYGLDNIKKIVEEHHGMIKINPSDYYEITIIIPIIDIKNVYILP